MPDIPWDVLNKSQRAAVGMFTGSVGKLVEMGRTGVTRPEELLREVTAMASAIGDLASSTARPLEFFIASQRQLAESMAAAINGVRRTAHSGALKAESFLIIIPPAPW